MKFVRASGVLLTPLDESLLLQIERAARTCYKSEDAACEGSAEKMVRRLIKSGHEAMLEHASLSVRFICDRGVTHEIVRHRMASYAQESTRYCNYGKDKFGSEVTYVDLAPGIDIEDKLSADQAYAVMLEWEVACQDAERHYLRMLELGASPQIARSVLNNSTKTEIVVTMNLREWRHFLKLRCAPDAHPQMCEIAFLMLNTFRERLPVIVEDIPYELPEAMQK
jgi:thymidylate synthase (FAD)